MELFCIFFITILSFYIIAIIKKGFDLHRREKERKSLKINVDKTKIIRIVEEDKDDHNE